MDHHRPEFEDLDAIVKELEELCEEDTDELTDNKKDTKEKWGNVNKLLDIRHDLVSDMQDQLRKLDDLERPTKDKLKKAEKTLETISLVGADKTKAKKALEDIKKLQKQVEDLEPKVDQVEKLTSDIQEGHLSSDCQPIRNEASEIRDRFETLKQRLDDKVVEVEEVVSELDKLEDDVNKAIDIVKGLSKDIDKNKPSRLATEDVKMQVENVKVSFLRIN